MEEKDLKKLKRPELLEIMLAQSEEIDRLRAELASKDAELESRRIAIQESGSIAEASLRLTHVFEEAQRAADLYLENVRANAGEVANAGAGASVDAASAGVSATAPAPKPAPAPTATHADTHAQVPAQSTHMHADADATGVLPRAPRHAAPAAKPSATVLHVPDPSDEGRPSHD